MFYSIRHITKFRYNEPVSESVMEVRMQPRSEAGQRTHTFKLQTTPRSQVQHYTDYFGNSIHHFDVPGRHSALTLIAEALVEVTPLPPLPTALDPGAWDALGALLADHDHWDMLQPSYFAHPTDELRILAHDIGLKRGSDPLSTLLSLNTAVYKAFEYAPQSTRVDSPIDDALRARRGVCQDLTHIMIALVRELGIPCRYVSGYLFHRIEDRDRSAADSTHAWVEALLPGLGWVGLDPTNNLAATSRHIRTAIGRDYADVPPTRGVYKGDTKSELAVSVRVSPSEAPPPHPESDEAGDSWQEQMRDGNMQDQQQQQQ